MGRLVDQSNQPRYDLRQRNGQVVSYLSIGEAETYRSYWTAAWETNQPAFLDAENPHWRGNFRVRYWDPQWQQLMLNAVERLVLAGFDGVYLDTIDTYEWYQQRGNSDARAEMLTFVQRLSSHARSLNPDFKIIAQNAAELTADSDYLAAIDGIANEDTFYEGDFRRSTEDIDDTLRHLATVKDAGKFVLTVDYAQRRGPVRDYCRLAQERQFAAIVAPRALNRVIDNPHQTCTTGPERAVAGN